LKSVPGDSTRPIMDRVKEALFNILSTRVEGTQWWDLFAGTGAVGIEALSRGAAFVRFSEISSPALEVLHWNIAHCGFGQLSEVLSGDALKFIRLPTNRVFDYIYVAPPQYKNLWTTSLQGLDANPGWVRPGGTIVVQIDPREDAEVDLLAFREIESRKYGRTLLKFLQR